jgi:cytochrome d ubiquinol oxidase subunit I
MGVVSGVVMSYQFGTNWAYYAQYVGDIFGIPLAIEGLTAFFLESTLIGLFLFGWDRLSKVKHLAVTWLVALGSNLSALWILIANAWMQHPVGTYFNEQTMRMELQSLATVFFNPVAQVKFVHTVASGYVTGSIFVLGISAYYLLKGHDIPFARRSFAIAAGFGLASVLSVIVLGDASGYTIGEVQKAKLAAIEGMWETEKPPAAFTLIGFPNDQAQRTDTPILGLKDLILENEQRIRKGMIAYGLLQQLIERDPNPSVKKSFDTLKKDLGYGLLLKRYTDRVVDATEADIKMAARLSVPHSALLFWCFRIMVGAGFLMLLLFSLAFYFNIKPKIEKRTWFLKCAIFAIPLPWIAAECGWIVAENGRQPWAIAEILPTFLGVSSISAHEVWSSLIALGLLYTALLIVELYLMFKYARLGPSSLQTGRYHFEKG